MNTQSVKQPPELIAQSVVDHMLDAGLDQHGQWQEPDHSLDGLRCDIAAYQRRPRRITPDAGHALETLGHAIDYLIDQFNGNPSYDADDLVAVQILMAANRQVYYNCPTCSTFWEWADSVIDQLAQKWGLPW